MKSIRYSFDIKRSIKDVWKMISTTEGIHQFFSPYTNIEFRVGGPFEIYFNMDEKKGSRGSEHMKIMAIETERMLGFTWNSPPQLGDIRKQRTYVNISLSEMVSGETHVEFINSGYGHSKEWNESYQYFVRAWGSIVLPRLRYALEVEPIDWEDQQDYLQYDMND